MKALVLGAGLAGVTTATVQMQLMKRGLRRCTMRGVNRLAPTPRMVGIAYTLRFVPFREDRDPLSRLGDEIEDHRAAREALVESERTQAEAIKRLGEQVREHKSTQEALMETERRQAGEIARLGAEVDEQKAAQEALMETERAQAGEIARLGAQVDPEDRAFAGHAGRGPDHRDRLTNPLPSELTQPIDALDRLGVEQLHRGQPGGHRERIGREGPRLR